MRAPSLLIAGLLLVSSGCADVEDGDAVDSAVVSVPTYSDGAGGHLLLPVALFYANSNIVFNSPVAGVCEVQPLGSDDSPIIPGFLTLDVGPHILAQLPGREDTLYQNIASGRRVYELGHEAGIAHSPGDTVRIDVPASAAFPAVTIAVRTAESFTIGPVDVPGPNNDLPLTWTAAPQPGSAMRFSLQYASGNSAELNEQLVCIFADDGEGEIDAGFLQGWVNAAGGLREVVATRIRANEVEPSSRSRILLLSFFQVPTQLLVP